MTRGIYPLDVVVRVIGGQLPAIDPVLSGPADMPFQRVVALTVGKHAAVANASMMRTGTWHMELSTAQFQYVAEATRPFSY